MSNGDFYPCSKCGKEVYRKDEHDCPLDAIDTHEDRIDELECQIIVMRDEIEVLKARIPVGPLNPSNQLLNSYRDLVIQLLKHQALFNPIPGLTESSVPSVSESSKECVCAGGDVDLDCPTHGQKVGVPE